jgi:hypothetical protein
MPNAVDPNKLDRGPNPMLAQLAAARY